MLPISLDYPFLIAPSVFSNVYFLDHIFDFFIVVFNATFSNISAISWLPVLVVEEAGVPGKNHLPWASNW